MNIIYIYIMIYIYMISIRNIIYIYMYTSAASCTITHVSFSSPVQGANRCRALVQDPHRVWFLWYYPCLGDWGLSMGYPIAGWFMRENPKKKMG